MTLSRRALFTRAAGSEAHLRQLISARGREALIEEHGPLAGEAGLIPTPQRDEIRLTSKENPYGPFEPSMEAIRDGFAGARDADAAHGGLRARAPDRRRRPPTCYRPGRGS